jgi:hypothetical protein
MCALDTLLEFCRDESMLGKSVIIGQGRFSLLINGKIMGAPAV